MSIEIKSLIHVSNLISHISNLSENISSHICRFCSIRCNRVAAIHCFSNSFGRHGQGELTCFYGLLLLLLAFVLHYGIINAGAYCVANMEGRAFMVDGGEGCGCYGHRVIVRYFCRWYRIHHLG